MVRIDRIFINKPDRRPTVDDLDFGGGGGGDGGSGGVPSLSHSTDPFAAGFDFGDSGTLEH